MEYRQARHELKRRSGIAGSAKRNDRDGAPHVHQARQVPVARQSRRRSADPVPVILAAGLAAEMVLPWAVIWLSDVFMFDTPDWLRWAIFGAPPALGFLAALTYWVARARSRQPVPAWTAARQGR
jgi:hypothetical protein